MALQLRHLDVDDLIESAGGDPWEIDRTVQAGSPVEINELATLDSSVLWVAGSEERSL